MKSASRKPDPSAWFATSSMYSIHPFADNYNIFNVFCISRRYIGERCQYWTCNVRFECALHETRDVAAAGFGCSAIDQSLYSKKGNEKQNESTLFRLAKFNSGRFKSEAQSAMQFRSFSMACIWTVDPATVVWIENTRHAGPGAVLSMPKIISLLLCVWVCSFSFVRFAHHWPLFKTHAIHSFANPKLPTYSQTLVSLSVRIYNYLPKPIRFILINGFLYESTKITATGAALLTFFAFRKVMATAAATSDTKVQFSIAGQWTANANISFIESAYVMWYVHASTRCMDDDDLYGWNIKWPIQVWNESQRTSLFTWTSWILCEWVCVCVFFNFFGGIDIGNACMFHWRSIKFVSNGKVPIWICCNVHSETKKVLFFPTQSRWQRR